jgi:hypothetical protein
MAIFASTTLGSSDPARAMSIKALEARAQALAAAQSKQEMPSSLPSPWQGASLVMNQAADAFAAKRADQAAAARRQELAGVMSGVGPEGPNPGQLAQITGADPDLGKTYLQQIAQQRAAAQQIQAQKEAAAEAAKTAETAAVSQEGRLQARPQTDAGKVKADLAAGKLSEEEAAAALKKLTAPSAGEQKIINEQQSAHIDLQSSVDNLKEAEQLLNQGVYSGGGAEFKEIAGKYAPSALGGITGTDPETTKRTQRYNQIMSPEALGALSKLKGASSDKDMMWAIQTVNDKSSSIENKKRALQVLQAKTQAHLQASEQTLKSMGGNTIKVETPPPAIAGGGVSSVASEAEALQLPAGTKFKLPDGRTGTAR